MATFQYYRDPKGRAPTSEGSHYKREEDGAQIASWREDAKDTGRSGCGKIGAIIKSVMARSSTFSLDVIYGKEENVVDADEIARIVTEFFALWFNSTDDDDARDAEVAKCTTKVNEEEWGNLASKLNVPSSIAWWTSQYVRRLELRG